MWRRMSTSLGEIPLEMQCLMLCDLMAFLVMLELQLNIDLMAADFDWIL
jgi:hypothetical protein